MKTLTAHFFAFAAPVLAAVSQLLIKWQTNQVGHLPDGFNEKALFLFDFLLRPWVILALVTTFISGVSWIIAMTKLDLSYAYPYVASTFILVPAMAIILFGEQITSGKIIGTGLILVGIGIVMLKG